MTAILTLVAAIIAAGSSLVGIWVNKQTAKSQALQAALTNIASQRIRWIEDTRRTYAEISSLTLRLSASELEINQHRKLQDQAVEKIEYFSLLFNQDEHSEILKFVPHLLRCVVATNDSKKSAEYDQDLRDTLHQVLKGEWEKAKTEMRGSETA